MKNLIKKYTNQESQKIGIYLRSWKNDDLLISKIKILSNILYKEGLEIFFIPMHQPEDKDFLQKILPLGVPYHTITENLDAEEMFALTGQIDAVISIRLHALIMGAAQGIPVVGLSYDPKVTAFMNQIGNEHCFDIDTFSPEIVAESVIAQLRNKKGSKGNIEGLNKSLIEEAQKPAKLISRMLS